MKNVPEIITNLVPEVPSKLFSENGLEPILSEIKKKVDAFKPDIETASGRKEVASFAYNITRSKTFLDGLGKELVADKKAKIKLADGERKRMRDTLDAEKDRARKSLDDWEAEEKRKEDLRRKEVEFNMDWDEALKEDDIYKRERAIAKKEEEARAREEAQRKKEEAERLEKERIEREERLQKEAAERVKREADERLRQAEKEKIQAEERAKIEQQQAIEKVKAEAEAEAKRLKEAAEQKEREAAEAKEAERKKEERRAANKRHQGKINREALDDLTKIIPGESAKKAIEAIIRFQIRHIKISY